MLDSWTMGDGPTSSLQLWLKHTGIFLTSRMSNPIEVKHFQLSTGLSPSLNWNLMPSTPRDSDCLSEEQMAPLLRSFSTTSPKEKQNKTKPQQ